MSKKLYIGNLSYNVDEGALNALFSQYGAVESVRIITDRDTGRSKGFAFVEMTEEADGLKAIENLNGTQQFERSMNVSVAKPMESRGGSRGGGGGFSRNRY
ncbi:RNA recognition motif domain-containing protein [Pseudobdellovibrio exovorus]|uniref:RRM domain-containing protein n=1 Tax=Pseudobdellovibrio exovorus JSS TaxID=1184267 RepID=M4VQC5_9BACT|nr:RNA-binding protein [Pseudobdellovibrio exovorus]AGH95359.1 hypothetical protein A11Q_1143 [Pseudobdellovibrio exovorus JSS]